MAADPYGLANKNSAPIIGFQHACSLTFRAATFGILQYSVECSSLMLFVLFFAVPDPVPLELSANARHRFLTPKRSPITTRRSYGVIDRLSLTHNGKLHLTFRARIHCTNSKKHIMASWVGFQDRHSPSQIIDRYILPHDIAWLLSAENPLTWRS